MSGVLRGFTVGITADRRWDEQASLFERRGATIAHGPSIRTLPLGSDQPLRDATDRVIARPPQVLIANTGLGMRSWFGAAESWGLGGALVEALTPTRIFARGPKASGAVHSMGLDVSGRAAGERMVEVVAMALAELRPGDIAAVQVDGSGGSVHIDQLRRRGVEVVEVPVYEWRLPEDRRPAIRLAESVIARRVHAVTFTTGPAVRNWLDITAEADLDQALLAALSSGDVVVGCVGPVTAEVAVAAGLPADLLVVPAAWRLGPLVRAVADRLAERTVRLEVRGVPMSIAGTAVTIGGAEVTLSDIEARVLATLAAKPNIVFTKAEILQAVWGNGDLDPHAVEVAVARLRRRLGPPGEAVASVHRRGYALRA
jgi:uroporphyrinogen-III synthase